MTQKPYIPDGGVRVIFRGRAYHLDWRHGHRVFVNSRGWESYYLKGETDTPEYFYGVYSIDTNKRVGSFQCFMRRDYTASTRTYVPYWHEPKA